MAMGIKLMKLSGRKKFAGQTILSRDYWFEHVVTAKVVLNQLSHLSKWGQLNIAFLSIDNRANKNRRSRKMSFI